MINKTICLLGCLLWLVPAAWGQSEELAAKIEALIAEKLDAYSDVGISVYDLTAQQPIYNYRGEKLCRPASTMKLLTTVAAISRPEANEPFRTEVWYKGTIEHDTLRGDLYVVGGFDPEFDDTGMKALTDAVITLPFSVIDGYVYGDVSMKDSIYFGAGWAWDDNPSYYHPYLSPLMLHKGYIRVTATPGEKGDTARLECEPASTYYTLTNETKSRTSSAGKFSVSRNWLENGNNVVVKGNVDTKRSGTVNIHDSGRFFMHTFLDRLQEQGMIITRGYAFEELIKDDTATHITTFESPVQTVISEVLKRSDNLGAEALLYRVAAQATGKKRVSAEDGLLQLSELVEKIGHDPERYRLADGSGLSDYNYLSPDLLVDLLKYSYQRTDLFQKLYKALPIAGIDGTLRNRMKSGKAYKNVHAKTGSIGGIFTLAGYLKTSDGREWAFAIMNQNVRSGTRAREFQDAVCELLCE